jgi:hypothetical protein
MKERILDATPEKRIFLSIISEYDLKRSICELIDNAIDLWSKTKRRDLKINIFADTRQQTLSIMDNAGGIVESKLDHIVSPGKTTNAITDDVIGYFGVGSKRAVVALAQDIAIHSRFENDKSYTIEIDEQWLTDEESWSLPYTESTRVLDPFTTLIELSRLRFKIDEDDLSELKQHLSEVYGLFIDRGTFIAVNGEQLKSRSFENEWSYPKNLFPTQFSAIIPIEDRVVNVEIVSGLIDHPGDPENSYGVFFYCNNRLIARALTDFSVGFTSGMIGNPHYNISLVRTIVKIRGQSGDMPWDSSKSGINLKHPIYQAVRQSIIDTTKRYAQISRSLQGRWDTEIFPFKTGRIITENVETIASIPKSYLPIAPASKQRWHVKVTLNNAAKLAQKPWTTGLLDSILAVDLISKQTFNQKNRISLIILDCTLEIAYKEYLVNEKNIGMTRFNAIADKRSDVEKEVCKYITISKKIIQKINHYYKLRCDLIHQRATPNVLDAQIDDYRTIVEGLLTKMFGLVF